MNKPRPKFRRGQLVFAVSGPAAGRYLRIEDVIPHYNHATDEHRLTGYVYAEGWHIHSESNLRTVSKKKDGGRKQKSRPDQF
jgi:hypothetical protein